MGKEMNNICYSNKKEQFYGCSNYKELAGAIWIMGLKNKYFKGEGHLENSAPYKTN